MRRQEAGRSASIRVAAIGLGGTISMEPGPRGLVAARSVAELFPARLLEKRGVALTCFDLGLGASASLSFDDIGRIAARIDQCASDGFSGVIIVQGTDTLEESAFAFELLCRPRCPVIVTGAMRGAAQPGSDGPANIAGALALCLSDRAPEGVSIVMNEEVHAARYARKAHTTALGAFTSGDAGLLGRLHEGRYCPSGMVLSDLRTFAYPPAGGWPRVALIPVVLGDDGTLLHCLEQGSFQGCILAAMGAGHVPEALVPQIERLCARMPVVLCSRAASGQVCTQTYGYPGSETDLLGRGVVSGGGLDALKARVLLTLCLAQKQEDARKLFSELVAMIR